VDKGEGGGEAEFAPAVETGMSMPGFNAMVLALAGALVACSEEAPLAPPTAVPLPTAEVLPYRFNQDCGCVRDGNCAILEEQPGYSEIRGLSCRWLRPGAVAECRFEERFTAHHYLAEGNFIESVGAWQPRRLRVIPLPDGGWCEG
jgi:hypothetical protein